MKLRIHLIRVQPDEFQQNENYFEVLQLNELNSDIFYPSTTPLMAIIVATTGLMKTENWVIVS